MNDETLGVMERLDPRHSPRGTDLRAGEDGVSALLGTDNGKGVAIEDAGRLPREVRSEDYLQRGSSERTYAGLSRTCLPLPLTRARRRRPPPGRRSDT